MTGTTGYETEDFEKLLETAGEEHYVLKLYVTGMTPRSTEAVARIKAICEEYLKDRYELEIVDVYQQSGQVKAEQIVAKVRGHGRTVWTVFAHNEGHGFNKKDNDDYLMAVEAWFLKKNFGL